MTSSPAPDRHPREDTVILILFLSAFVWSVLAASVGWSHAISDWYGWRQTQTAIAAYFMQQGGPWLDYQVPMLGPPWQMPHEFPLYQVLVVTLARVSGLPLEAAARGVSLAMFYCALAAGHLLLGELGVARQRRLLVLAFWLVSPLYLFWSRAFMIESTALCLCLFFLLFAGRFAARGRAADAVLAVLAGCLGAAVKPPTVVPCAALAGVWWLHAQLRPQVALGKAVRATGALVIVLAPFAGWVWQQHADALKERNPFGWGISSGQLLRDWVSPLSLTPIEPQAVEQLWGRAIPFIVGHPVVLAAAVVGVAVAGRRRRLFALALCGFVVHFAAFAPLDCGFDYYWYGAGLYLVAAVGVAAIALLECDDGRRHLAWVLVALVAGFGVHGWVATMLPIQRLDAYRKPDWVVRLARAVSDATGPEDVIVVFGMDWNPELPYYAKRRALMWPTWGDPRPWSDDLGRALVSLEGHPVGALISCRETAPPETMTLLRDRWRLVPSPVWDGRCALHVRPPVSAAPVR
jgi:hypothetical protein